MGMNYKIELIVGPELMHNSIEKKEWRWNENEGGKKNEGKRDKGGRKPMERKMVEGGGGARGGGGAKDGSKNEEKVDEWE